jgi:hypothetical protein
MPSAAAFAHATLAIADNNTLSTQRRSAGDRSKKW